MVLWVNCHPAFLLAFAITSVYLAATAIKMLSADQEAVRRDFMTRSGLLCALLVGLLVVSFINPYGVQLYQYIAEYLHGTSILAHTDEFKSPNFHFNIHAICLEILFFALALGFVRNGKKVSLPAFMLTMMFGHLSLWAVRNIPLFAFVTMPLLGRLFGPKDDETSSGAASVVDTAAIAPAQTTDISPSTPSIFSNIWAKLSGPVERI